MEPTGVDETIESARWSGPVDEAELAATEAWLGARLPSAWTAFLRRDTRLERGWLRSGVFVRLDSPAAAREQMEAWEDALDAHPGFYQLGTDGSRVIVCIDLRDPERGVMVTDIVSEGWDEADALGYSVEEFVRRIDDGGFAFFPDRAD